MSTATEWFFKNITYRWFSKWCPCSIRSTWELTRNAKIQASAQTHWIRNCRETEGNKVERRKIRGTGQQPMFWQILHVILVYCKVWEPLLYTTVSFFFISKSCNFLLDILVFFLFPMCDKQPSFICHTIFS